MFSHLKNCSLYKQLIIPMMMVGVVGVCATVYSAFALHESVNALGEMYESGDVELRRLENIESSVTRYRALILRHLASESAQVMSELVAELEQTRESIERDVEVAAQTHTEHGKMPGMTRSDFSELVALYFTKVSEIVQQSRDFEKETAFMGLTLVENEFPPKLNGGLQTLKRHAFDDISRSRHELMSAASRNMVITISIGLVGGGLLLVIAFAVTRRVTLRLSQLLNWSREISAGNLSASLADDSLDELGRLNSAMGEMARSIQQAHGQLAEAKGEAEDVAETLRIYANAFEKSGESILITDNRNNILNVNEAFTERTGYSRDEVIGQNPRILASGKTAHSTYVEMWDDLEKDGFWQGELWNRNKSGEITPWWTVISAIRNADGEVSFYIAGFNDISERKKAEAYIERLAHHDILTGLHNRFSLEDRSEQVLAIARREQQQAAIFFIDLDNFKNINDVLGHQAGDQLLIEVAKRLKQCVRDSDIVARIGGDEFVMVFSGISDGSHVADIAENVRQQITKLYEIDGNEFSTTPSIGISIFPDDGDTADELLRNADVAMYHAKEQGKNSFHFYTESMHIAAHERLRIEHELRSAIDRGQLELHYQPQIGVKDQGICTVEALIRWNHPEQGLIMPARFVSIAEDSGLIRELGKWVFGEACRQLAEWKAGGVRDVRIAINLSAKQLQSEGLTEQIRSIMQAYQVKAGEIELEITETATMNEPELALEQLNALRELGVFLAIDDFGTGYSSLAYLKRLPIHALKLDKSFVSDLENDPNDAAICRATLALAHTMGLEVVAEGVETAIQHDFLVSHKFDRLQGFLYSKPLPAAEMTEYLRGPDISFGHP